MEKQKTQQKIAEITRKIVEEYQPEKIILFGSYAWGKPTDDSDVDLLVVKDSQKPRLDRQRELRRKLYPPLLPMDLLVYTVDELNEKIDKDRNLFLEDVVKNGVALYENHQLRSRLARSSR